ncbi:ROK family protein [Chloroflexota bacterium]
MVSDMQETGKQRLPVLVVDLGGTKITAAIISPQMEIIARHNHPTLASEGPEAVIGRMFSGIDHLLEKSDLTPPQLGAISIADAGIIDIKRGLVTTSPNLPNWNNIPLKSIVEEKYGVTTFLINDADAAALGEHRLGAGKGLNTIILLTLGTGIGGGIIINGRLYLGPTGSAAEIGHMVIEASGPPCNCGKRGCLETFSSGTAIARDAINRIGNGEKSSLADMVGGDIEKITAEKVYLAAKDGDSLSLEVIAGAACYLGIGVANLVNIFNPEMVIIGGSVANIGDLLLDPVRQVVKEQAFGLLARTVRIAPALLGNDAGIFGAAIYAAEQ